MMRQPTKFGQKISEKRKVLHYVKNHHKEISSYEIGKNGSGFRFVYPIMFDNEYVGALGITFKEQAFTSFLTKQYHVLSNFAIKDDDFSKDFLKNSKNYKKSNIEGFLHNVNILKDLKEAAKEDLSKIRPSKKTSANIYINAMKKKTYSFYIKEQNTIVTTIPIIHTLQDEQKAFIAILSNGQQITDLNKNYITILLLFIVLYAAIALIIYQQSYKNLIEKENLNEIIQKDKQLLEQAKLAQMGEMIGNIAHQWRQPLSTISTAASGLKMKQEFNMLEEKDIPEYTDIIVSNTQYLSETIETFRDFIKEAKDKKNVILQDRIDEIIKIIRASLTNNHIELINQIDYEEPIEIEIIAEELSQVLINILNNARDAILQREIENGKIIISLEKKANLIFIHIEDNAGGIKEEILDKIFDPYFTTKHEFQGTGLGLYMSKIMIEKHLKGKLYVKNKEKGAKFTIELNA